MRMQPSTEGLEAGECRVTLTRSEWNILHFVLRRCQEVPEVFGADIVDNPAGARVLAATVFRIKAKLPPEGAGGY